MRKFNAFVTFNLCLTTTTIFNAKTSGFKASTMSRNTKHNTATHVQDVIKTLSTIQKNALYDCPRCIFFNYLRSSANCQSKFHEFCPSEKSKCDKLDTGPGTENALILGKQANLPR